MATVAAAARSRSPVRTEAPTALGTLYGHGVLVSQEHAGSTSMERLCRTRSFGTEVRELSAILLSLEEALFLQSELHVLDVQMENTAGV
ncbi:unnamed protein product [Symbiodinium natans]|uniref:Uncharacterized protein n=1 Tax=Symbiodinium natans TaxID=878477 RepID=A0A812RNU7_9DINO|nr:unnamed protein product [Symbiodinium natans]